jgi:membrane fusion protein, heavy metal efflux system
MKNPFTPHQRCDVDISQDLSGKGEAPATDVAPTTTKGLPRRTQFAMLLVAVLLIAGGYMVGLPGSRVVNPPAGNAADKASTAEVGTVKLTDKQWAGLKIAPAAERVFQDASETDGKIAVDDDLVTPVFSPYSGRVTRLIARAGDTIAHGDPLFAIQAAELAQAQNDLISAGAALRTAKAQLQLAQTNEKRQHDLFLAQGAALKDWQQSQVDLATAQGGMNSTSIALAAVRNRLRILGKDDRDISALEASADILRIDAETIVTAPINGTVVQRQIGLGQNIVSASSGASNPVFLIGDLSKVWLIANVREGEAPQMHKGDPVDVSVLAFPGRTFHAQLTYVASSMDPNTHRLPVRAEVDNPRGELKPEMFATFRIVTGEDAAAPSVRAESVIYEGATAHVWAADPAAKTLRIREIKPGRTRDGVIEVLSGLQPNEQVVTSGAVFIDRAASGD